VGETDPVHVHHDHPHHHFGNTRRMKIALAINLAMLFGRAS
jgi:hypothetical protein